MPRYCVSVQLKGGKEKLKRESSSGSVIVRCTLAEAEERAAFAELTVALRSSAVGARIPGHI